MESIRRVVVVGSGNVATALLTGLSAVEVQISQLIARNALTGKMLAQKFGCEMTQDLQCIDREADAVFICVQDDQLPLLIPQIPVMDAIIVHTSGSTSLDIFDSFHKHFGVFYPMQTFSASLPVQWDQIPIYIEGSTPFVESKIMELALKLSPKVQFLASDARMQLHVAAVFACNFTNLMLGAAADLMQQNSLDFGDLKQLVECTVNKAFTANHPDEVQTGPAIRNDKGIMDKHLKSLSLSPQLEEIYAFLSEQIQKKKQ